MYVGPNGEERIDRRGVVREERVTHPEPGVANSLGSNRLAAPSPTGQSSGTASPTERNGVLTHWARGSAQRRSGWMRPPVIITGSFFLAVVLGGYAVSAVAGSDSTAASYVNQLGQLAAAVVATAASCIAAARHAGRQRRAWTLVALACGSWSIGQLYWCYVELVLGHEVAEVSIGDIFFLAFTALMAYAVWPSGGRRTDRLKTLLDAFIIGMSLFVISWATSIHYVASTVSSDTDLFGLLINLAYPCGDIVVLTLVLLNASRRRGRRGGLTAVAVAMALFAISDGFYAYIATSGDFESGSAAGLGWIAGFGLIGCAALAGGQQRRGRRAGEHGKPIDDTGEEAALRQRGASILPYLPLCIALIVVGSQRLAQEADRATALLVIIIFIGVLLRQYVTIRENVALTRILENRELELQRQAFEDGLTGLPNRALFSDRVTHALEQHRRSLRPLSLLFVDLDDFKVVNDTLGHPVGDELVIRVAERLRGTIRAGDTVARFGGDEFAVLVEGGDGDAIHVGNRVVESLRLPFVLSGEQLSIGASVGIAEVPGDQQTPELDELFSRADIAMYAAKRAGKGQIALYDPSMVIPEAADLRYRPLLITAVNGGSIECVFQPVIDLDSGRVHSMEALARWRVDGDVVAPDYFINLAGRLGLLPALTDLMLDKACAQLADWSIRYSRDDLQVGVNVPAGLMTDPEFPGRVAAALQRHGLATNRLLLEITEEALLGELAVAQQVADRLQLMGVHLWLDDFGTGYSSLLSLRQIALQAVKIDIAFVENIHTDPSAEQFLRALLALGRDLGLLVTAEGVEVPEQAAILRSLGCQFAQGYLYARPAAAVELEHLLGPIAPIDRDRHPSADHDDESRDTPTDWGTVARVAVL